MDFISKSLDSLLDDAWEDEEEEQSGSSVSCLDPSKPEAYENNKLPVSIREFAESPKYMNLKGQLYEENLKILENIEDGAIREGNLVLGKGSGKSMLSEIFLAYGIYTAILLKEPQKVYGLTWNTAMYAINVSISRQQAQNVIFKQTKSLLQSSPFFKDKIIANNNEEMEFIKNIHFMCGHSGSTAFLGYATFRAVMDEANFMVDNNNRSVASDLYAALVGSLRTRFPHSYKILIVSSDSTPNSFLRESINRIIEDVEKKAPNTKKEIYNPKDLCHKS